MENEFSACVSDGNRLPRDKSQPEPPRREIRTRRSGRTQPADWGEGGLTRSRGCTVCFTLANRFNDNLIIREERPLVHSKSSFFRHCARLRVLLSNKILLGGKKKNWPALNQSSLVSTAGDETQFFWMQREIRSPPATRAAERLSVCGRPTHTQYVANYLFLPFLSRENVVHVEKDFYVFFFSIFAKNMGK